MTKLKEFRETVPSWMKMSFFDVLQTIDPSKTNKFLPMLSNMVINHFEKKDVRHNNELRHELEIRLPIIKNQIQNFDTATLWMVYHLSQILSLGDLETIFEFIQMYENHQIPNVDINKLKSFNELETIITLVGIKNLGKEYAKQIHVDLENEKWLIVRPLTHEASLKYGANTRWCTASKSNPYQYFRYTENGVLVYCINKENGYKLAFHMFKENDGFYEISFWNSADDRIDSLTAEIDYDVFNLIRNMYSNNNTKTNKELGGEYWTKSYEAYLDSDKKSIEDGPVAETTLIRAGRLIENNDVVQEPEMEREAMVEYDGPTASY